ncbi:MAG: ribose 5-phosphate isomerase B [Deltaproteobacteria bacterium]|nr:ribose 5-phosphate isomerase B [Deltaproteobacteria bacterium]
MKLAIATDHGGYPLKKSILDYLSKNKISYLDLGSDSEDSVDYPDYALKVAQMVSTQKVDGGILLCGTGIGMAIVANKFKGVRAAVLPDIHSAKMSKAHNNVNVIALGGRVLEAENALDIIRTWLETPFENARHSRRLAKISEIEEENFK